MATDYSVDITKNVQPASANAGYAVAATQQSGQAVANAVEAIGSTIWEGIKGYQGQAYRQEQQAYIDELGAEMAGIKNADIINRGFATTKPEDKVLSVYRQEQSKLAKARDQMPQRYREFRTRSEKLIKEYIAKMPGLANEFRSIAKEVTGLNDVDTYSVQQLYKDISFIEKNQGDIAEAQAKQTEMLRKAYVSDRARNGISETQANTEFMQFNPEQRLRVANAAVAAEQSKKNIDEQLKAGGNALLQITNTARAEWPNQSSVVATPFYAQLKQMGVTQADIASGAIPEGVASSPKYKQLISDGSTAMMQALDGRYREISGALRSRMSGADADKARQALSDLDDWYKREKGYIESNGMAASLGAIAKSDPLKTMKDQLGLIKLVGETYGVPPEVSMRLLENREGANYKAAAAQYPAAAAAFDLIFKGANASLGGATNEDFIAIIQSKSKAVEEASIPKTPVEMAGRMVVQEDAAHSLRQVLQGQGDESTLPDKLSTYVTGALTNGYSADKLLKAPALVQQSLQKLPEGEKGAVIDKLNTTAMQMVYGFNSHGDEAFARLEQWNAYNKNYEASIADVSGNSPLKLSGKWSGGEVTTGTGRVGVPTVPAPGAANSVLATVDKVLRVQSLVSGTPITQLRKDFIAAWQTGKKPSDTLIKEKPAKEALTAAPLTEEDKTLTPKASMTDEEVMWGIVDSFYPSATSSEGERDRAYRAIAEGDAAKRKLAIERYRSLYVGTQQSK